VGRLDVRSRHTKVTFLKTGINFWSGKNGDLSDEMQPWLPHISFAYYS